MGEITAADFVNFVNTVNDTLNNSLSKQNDIISAQNTAIGRLEGKLDNGIHKDIRDLKKYREIDKVEAIKNRIKDRELIMSAIKKQVTVCPNTFSIKLLSGKIKKHIKSHENIKTNKKDWIKWLIPVILSAGALILSIIIFKHTGRP